MNVIDSEIKWIKNTIKCKLCEKSQSFSSGITGDKELDKLILKQAEYCVQRSVCDSCLSDNKAMEDLKELNKAIAEKIKELPYNNFDPSRVQDSGRLAEIMKQLWQSKRCAFVQGVYESGKTRSCANIFVTLAHQMVKGSYLKASDLIDECTSLAVEKNKDAVNLKLKMLIGSNKLIMIDDIDKFDITLAGGEVLYKLLDLIIEQQSDCVVWFTANNPVGHLLNKFKSKDVGQAFISRIERMNFLEVSQNGIKWNVKELLK